MNKETVIWGLAPNESQPYMEQVLFHKSRIMTEDEIKTVTEYAIGQGFHHIRVSIIDLSKPPRFI